MKPFTAYLTNNYGKVVKFTNEKDYKEAKDKVKVFRDSTKKEIDAQQKEDEARYYTQEQNRQKYQTEKDKQDAKVFTEYQGLQYILPTGSYGRNDGYGCSGRQIEERLKKLEKMSSGFDGQDISLVYATPRSTELAHAKKIILYSMFESTKLPAEWKEYIKKADLILTPSEYCKEEFKPYGIETKVVPLGYDPTHYYPRERRKDKKEFVFLHYNAFNMRKGFLELLEAFSAEFQPDEPVKLILKCNNPELDVKLPPSAYPNIQIIRADYKPAQLAELISQSDCFVFPSRGEGFGITPLESMACGTPVIVPNAHGIADYFDPDICVGIKYGNTKAVYNTYAGDLGTQIICDIDDLRAKMRYAVNHREEMEMRGQMGIAHAKKWTIDQTVAKLKLVIDEFRNQHASN